MDTSVALARSGLFSEFSYDIDNPTDAKEVINLIYQWYQVYQMIPTADDLANKKVIVNPEKYNSWLMTDDVKSMLHRRGIISALTNVRPEGFLDPLQVALISALTDPEDSRSLRKKLADLEISQKIYEGWKVDPNFMGYYKIRAEQIFSNALPDVQRAHLKKVQRGDTKAMEMYYEITGRWSKGQKSDINPEVFLMQILEVAQMAFSHDPVALSQFANGIRQLGGGKAILNG